jgi:Methyltransferase domain
VTFTADWSTVRGHWDVLLADLVGQPGLRFLEVGCFEGMATLWLLENVLTGPGSVIVVVDTFQGSLEHGPMGVDTDDLEARFRGNVHRHRERVEVHVGESCHQLRHLSGGFDFIYLDGSHRAPDVLTDSVLAWDLLKPGGLLCWDDYAWGREPLLHQLDRPEVAVDAFLACYRGELEEVYRGYQVVVQKRDLEADRRLGIIGDG